MCRHGMWISIYPKGPGKHQGWGLPRSVPGLKSINFACKSALSPPEGNSDLQDSTSASKGGFPTISQKLFPCFRIISFSTVGLGEFWEVIPQGQGSRQSHSNPSRQLSVCLKANQGFPGGAVVKNPPANEGTRVRALVREDPTCHGATKPMRHNYWACALEPTSHNYWAHEPQLLKPVRLEPLIHNKRSPRTATKSSSRSPQVEKARAQQWRPNTAKNK